MAKNPYQGGDYDYFEAARDKETGAVKQTGLAPSAKLSNFGAAFNAARKSGQKTFEFKGKKYTTEMAKPKAKPAEKGPDTATLDRIAAKQRDEDKGPDKATVDRLARKQADEAKGPSDADLDRMAKKFDSKDRPGSEVLAEKMEKGQPKMQGAYREAFGNIRKALGFKSGGSVKMSGASKRADGCAKRGKTRGRMV
jgi:hypothetical protein